MKNSTTILFIILAVICLVLGLVDKLFDAKLFLQGYIWHELAQTFLLFSIAWGIWHNNKKEANYIFFRSKNFFAEFSFNYQTFFVRRVACIN